jgi:hypothetical protein
LRNKTDSQLHSFSIKIVLFFEENTSFQVIVL